MVGQNCMDCDWFKFKGVKTWSTVLHVDSYLITCFIYSDRLLFTLGLDHWPVFFRKCVFHCTTVAAVGTFLYVHKLVPKTIYHLMNRSSDWKLTRSLSLIKYSLGRNASYLQVVLEWEQHVFLSLTLTLTLVKSWKTVYLLIYPFIQHFWSSKMNFKLYPKHWLQMYWCTRF